MKTLILSGVGGSTNWLPLISPLVLSVIIAYSVNFLVKYFRKRRLERENNLINDLNGYFEDVRTHNPERSDTTPFSNAGRQLFIVANIFYSIGGSCIFHQIVC